MVVFLCLFFIPSLCLSLSIDLSVSDSLFLFFSLSLSICLRLSVSLSIYLSIYLSISQFLSSRSNPSLSISSTLSLPHPTYCLGKPRDTLSHFSLRSLLTPFISPNALLHLPTFLPMPSHLTKPTQPPGTDQRSPVDLPQQTLIMSRPPLTTQITDRTATQPTNVRVSTSGQPLPVAIATIAAIVLTLSTLKIPGHRLCMGFRAVVSGSEVLRTE